MSSPLYKKCDHCEGSRKLVRDYKTGRIIGATNALYTEVYPAGSACPFCKTGYNEIGMTDAQILAVIEERDALLSFALSVYDSIPSHWLPTTTVPRGHLIGLKANAAELTKGKRGRIEEFRFRQKQLASRLSLPKSAVPDTPPPEALPETPKPSSD